MQITLGNRQNTHNMNENFKMLLGIINFLLHGFGSLTILNKKLIILVLYSYFIKYSIH